MTLKNERKIIDSTEPLKSARMTGLNIQDSVQARPFLQPLAVAVVCLILVLLVLIMGIIDLRSLEKTLIGYMQNRGLDTIRNIQQIAENNFHQLAQMEKAGLYDLPVTALTEDAFSLQESLINEILDLAQEIDSKRETGRLNEKQLKFYISEEMFYLIAFLNEQGTIMFKSRSVPISILSIADPVIKGFKDIMINIFSQSGQDKDIGFVALRRKSGKGTIILALDNAGFRYWNLRVSIQRAINEVGQISGTVYLLITDQEGRVISQSGEALKVDQGEFIKRRTFKGKEGVTCRNVVLDGKNLLEIIAPIRLGGGIAGIVRLGFARARTDQVLKKERSRVFISMAFMVFISVLSMWLLFMNQNRHLARMREMETRLYKAERLSALGRLAAGVAHEIRNPLNAISMASQRLQRDNLHKLTGIIRDEIRRLNSIIEEFLGFSRTGDLEFRHQDLGGLLKEIVLLIEEEALSKGVTLKTLLMDSPLMVSMNSDRLKQAFFNIIKNAIESIHDEGSVIISIELEGKEWVSIRISDTGAGLTVEETDLIFNPDYTTKEKGLGLGLPIAYEIIRGHGGEVHVQSQPGTGTMFQILLPFNNK